MFKKSILTNSLLLALVAPSVVMAEDHGFLRNVESSGELKNETALFTRSGTVIGATSAHHGGDMLKFENSARIFINGDLGEESSMHAEVRFVVDSELVDGENGDSYKFHESYTQRDFFRELYVDTEFSDWSFRIGKQQVVWGTADGIKLLDIVNPTDFSEMAQNVMEESRIPVWMMTAEKTFDNGGNLQFVVSQPKENIFVGMDRNISTSVRANATTTTTGVFNDLTAGGHRTNQPFILLGVDSITGKRNGFLNIVPDLGTISRAFSAGFDPAGGLATSAGNMNAALMDGFTVGGFAGFTMQQVGNALEANGAGDNVGAFAGYLELPPNFEAAVTQVGTALSIAPDNVTGAQMLQYGFAPSYDTNLAVYTSSGSDSAFEYMDAATFRTFDAFVNAKSQYVYDMPDDFDVDIAFRYKQSLDNGLNYSVNYSYNYDKNPIINLSWRNDAGQLLTKSVNTTTNTITLARGATNYGGAAGNPATLRFEQTVERAHNLGAAMDFGLDTEALGAIVLRGEFLYQKDVYSPIMNHAALRIGDLVDALTMQKGDRFKYVLGADVTVMTNLLISGQFIQDVNLDYVDTTSSVGNGITGARYTADFATMHLTNNFNKAEEAKEFYSLFLSKPFGSEQQHRWNNIYMFEENGGNWNRFDVEWSFNDNMIGMFEYNAYWGDGNTQFGQLEDSSNVQVGFKYIFEDY